MGFDNANNSIGELQVAKTRRHVNNETADTKYEACYQIIYDPEEGNSVYIDSDYSNICKMGWEQTDVLP